MEVYVLLGSNQYEGYALLGVYHTKADAEMHRDLYKNEGKGAYSFDYYEVERRVVGARAKEDWEMVCNG